MCVAGPNENLEIWTSNRGTRFQLFTKKFLHKESPTIVKLCKLKGLASKKFRNKEKFTKRRLATTFGNCFSYEKPPIRLLKEAKKVQRVYPLIV